MIGGDDQHHPRATPRQDGKLPPDARGGGDAKIGTACQNIGDRVLADALGQFDANAGMRRAERHQILGQPQQEGAGIGHDPHDTATFRNCNLPRHCGDALGDIRGAARHDSAGRRQFHPFAPTHHQPHPQPRLQLRDALADSGGGEVQQLRAAGKAASFAHRTQHTQAEQVEPVSHLSHSSPMGPRLAARLSLCWCGGSATGTDRGPVHALCGGEPGEISQRYTAHADRVALEDARQSGPRIGGRSNGEQALPMNEGN